ncbi:hypothetical protein K438DRAFT_1759238 [Mycena galopus ATCC 62051]|nr:hypothetical protein K438DRAFT_1759238 [Mycena galopus ATCC 62051]
MPASHIPRPSPHQSMNTTIKGAPASGTTPHPQVPSGMPDHLPRRPSSQDDNSNSCKEKWTLLTGKNANFDGPVCGQLDDSKVMPALLYKEITGKTSEPNAVFVKDINKMLERANQEFLTDIPRCALAKAYARRAAGHGRDFEKAIVDYLISLQLFPEGNEEQENKVRREMLNVMNAFFHGKGNM